MNLSDPKIVRKPRAEYALHDVVLKIRFAGAEEDTLHVVKGYNEYNAIRLFEADLLRKERKPIREIVDSVQAVELRPYCSCAACGLAELDSELKMRYPDACAEALKLLKAGDIVPDAQCPKCGGPMYRTTFTQPIRERRKASPDEAKQRRRDTHWRHEYRRVAKHDYSPGYRVRKPWTVEDDIVLFKHTRPEAARLLGRSYHSVRRRRSVLRKQNAVPYILREIGVRAETAAI